MEGGVVRPRKPVVGLRKSPSEASAVLCSVLGRRLQGARGVRTVRARLRRGAGMLQASRPESEERAAKCVDATGRKCSLSCRRSQEIINRHENSFRKK